MKVLVTGGAGFIGSHSVDALIAAGHQVAVVDDLSSGRRSLVHPGAEFHEVDVRSADLETVFTTFEPRGVLHLAAQMDVRRSIEDPLFDADVNVRGTVNVLKCCVEAGVQNFVFSSTGGAIYGEPEVLPAREDTPPAPICPYGVSKFAGEAYARFYARVHGLNCGILRYGNVYGPRQNPHGEAGVCAIFARLMLAGNAPTLYGHGRPVRDYVYVADVVRANLLALDSPSGQSINIASGRGTTVRELFDILQEETGFEGEPVLEALRPGEVEGIVLDVDLARETMGWAAEISLREGLAETVAYIRAEEEAAR